jgi:serine/threonine-protein kinase
VAKIAALFVFFLAITGTAAYLTLTWIIKSEDAVVVPELVGKDVVYVLEILTDLGLNTKVKGSEYNASIPKNHVIIQEPRSGAEIKKGRDVRIILSKGTRTIPMPNLIGLVDRQARLVLEENNLCLGHASHVYYDQADKKGTVISQTPDRDTLIERGHCVNLLISIGQRPRAYKMADLTGLSIDEAVVLIEKSHLQVGRFKFEMHADRSENIIVDQNPKPGYRIFEKTPVHMVVNRKTDPKSNLSLEQVQLSGFFRYHMEPGFIKKHVQIRLDIMGISSELFNAYVKPNEEVWLLIPTTSIATIFLYEDGELVKTQVYNTW